MYTFNFPTSISAGSAGQHSFHFEGSICGVDPVRYPATGELQFNISSPSSGPLALTLTPNPVNIGQPVTVSTHTALPNYPIGFTSSNASIGNLVGNMPIYSDNNGNISITFLTTQTGTTTITAYDWYNQSTYDQKTLAVIQPSVTLSIILTPQRVGVASGVVSYNIYYTVLQNGQAYPNFTASVTTNFGTWSNGQQTMSFSSNGNYTGHVTLGCTGDGTANISMTISGNVASMTLPIQYNLPPFSPFETVSTPGMNSMSYCPLNNHVAYVSSDRYLRVYDLTGDSLMSTFGPYIVVNGTVNIDLYKVRYSPDGTKIFIMGRGAKVVNASNGSVLAENGIPQIGANFEGDAQWISNSQVVAAYYNNGNMSNPTVSIFNASDLSIASTLSTFTNSYQYATINIAGSEALITFSEYPYVNGATNGTAFLYNTSNWSLISGPFTPVVGNGVLWSSAISADGSKSALYDDRYQDIYVLNNSNWGATPNIISTSQTYGVWSLKFNPVTTNYLAAASGSDIVLYNTTTNLADYTDLNTTAGQGLEEYWSTNGERLIAATGGSMVFYAPFDVAPPVIAFSAPVDSFKTYQSSLQVGGSITASDNTVAAARYRINGSAWISLTVTSGQFSIQAPLSPGWNSIDVFAMDGAGRHTQSTIGGTWILPPAAAALASPANDSINVPLNTVLEWHSSPTATHYTVQLATDSLFHSLTLYDTSIVDTFRVTTGLVGGNKYYWRVGAANGGGMGGWSTGWSFLTFTYPTAQLNKTWISFSSDSLGYVYRDSVKIKNTSTNPLTIDSVYTSTKWFSTTLTKNVCRQNDSAYIRIAFSPDSTRGYLDTLYRS